ncbi:MAG: response regulator, partial [Pseudomonadota bacterium]
KPSVILYIDDEPASVRLVSKVLTKRRNYMLLDASTGEEGLLMAQFAGPELKVILVDINLPDHSGYHILERCRQMPNTRDLPIMAVSANAMTHEIEAGLKAGFDRYLTKPLNIPAFIDIIDNAIDFSRRKTHQE